MNEDDEHHERPLENGHQANDNDADEPKISLQEKRRKYLEEKKKKMNKRAQPAASISEMLNKVEDTDRSFLNVQVHANVPKHPNYDKNVKDEDCVYCVGELEIADFLTFNDIVPKAIELFNSQLREQGYEMEFILEKKNKYSFKFAKKSGKPDSNFPAFDGSQKVSDCGITNICMVYNADCVRYPNAMSSKAGSTVAATENNFSEG